MILGRHAILEGFNADAELLNDLPAMELLLREACKAAGATILKYASHQFNPQGVTVVCLLAESHASIHTYPEHGIYMADIFTCGDVEPGKAVEVIKQRLGGDTQEHLIERPIGS